MEVAVWGKKNSLREAVNKYLPNFHTSTQLVSHCIGCDSLKKMSDTVSPPPPSARYDGGWFQLLDHLKGILFETYSLLIKWIHLALTLTLALMQPPLSICGHHSVVLSNVPPKALSDWLHITSNSLSTLKAKDRHRGTHLQTGGATVSERSCVAKVAINITILYTEVAKTPKSYNLFLWWQTCHVVSPLHHWKCLNNGLLQWYTVHYNEIIEFIYVAIAISLYNVGASAPGTYLFDKYKFIGALQSKYRAPRPKPLMQ